MTTALHRVEQLRLLGRFDDAERAAREALAASPNDPGLLLGLAAVLYESGRLVDGLAAAEAASAAAPEFDRPQVVRAAILSGLGRHDEAVEAAYRAVTLAPEETPGATMYAEVLKQAGRLPEAAQAARRVVELAPNSPASHFLLADVTSGLGDKETARQAYEEVLRLDPQHAVARHDLAVLDARGHRPAQALRGLIDAGMLAPGMPKVMQTIRAVLWQLSWRLRMLLGLATVAVIVFSGEDPLDSTWSGRIAAAVTLVIAGGLTWWTVRNLPKQTRPVVRAALQGDGPLRFTYVAVAACVLLLVVVLITGVGVFAALVWLVLGLLGGLAIVVRTVRRLRHG
ncbi:tetratricopeptide repeat protein [Pseudonocardia alaniniphila]|uniref:Tetratricopeptide repeat protein n=1 Tax=Pseudonocardia alaniniphila TaxID=75291 RepID=A0ABS9TDM4_9PSEU|nr:tetratricopeptide repeat protein [Pseudonocardia alaniniphila]MCH6166645.1 tetratricopeptide repeat protein [Pseudonocardia alaniniphila]